MGRAEGGDHPRQGGVGARAHVQRGGGQPGRIDTDHCNNSRSIWVHWAAADKGQCTVTDMPGRWHSIRMSAAGIEEATLGCSLAAVDAARLSSIGMKVGV